MYLGIKKYNNSKFKYHAYLFKYEGEIRNKIIEYKFNEKSYLCHTFWKLIVNDNKIYNFIKDYDIIISVPMYKTKKTKRGYNQAEIIAKEIGKTKLITYEKKILVKTKNTETQSSLNKTNRLNNIKGAFKIQNAEKIRNKKVIIFDDIYTTGATANECAKIVKQAGVKEVSILTIAKD